MLASTLVHSLLRDMGSWPQARGCLVMAPCCCFVAHGASHPPSSRIAVTLPVTVDPPRMGGLSGRTLALACFLSPIGCPVPASLWLGLSWVCSNAVGFALRCFASRRSCSCSCSCSCSRTRSFFYADDRLRFSKAPLPRAAAAAKTTAGALCCKGRQCRG